MMNPNQPITKAHNAYHLYKILGEEALLAYIETMSTYLTVMTPWEHTDTISFEDSSSVSRHLPDKAHPSRQPHYHFNSLIPIEGKTTLKEPANPSLRTPTHIDNIQISTPTETEEIIFEIVASAERIARKQIGEQATDDRHNGSPYTEQNHQRAIAIFIAAAPHAQYAINELLILTNPPEESEEAQLFIESLTKEAIGKIEKEEWLAIVESMRKIIAHQIRTASEKP